MSSNNGHGHCNSFSRVVGSAGACLPSCRPATHMHTARVRQQRPCPASPTASVQRHLAAGPKQHEQLALNCLSQKKQNGSCFSSSFVLRFRTMLPTLPCCACAQVCQKRCLMWKRGGHANRLDCLRRRHSLRGMQKQSKPAEWLQETKSPAWSPHEPGHGDGGSRRGWQCKGELQPRCLEHATRCVWASRARSAATKARATKSGSSAPRRGEIGSRACCFNLLGLPLWRERANMR